MYSEALKQIREAKPQPGGGTVPPKRRKLTQEERRAAIARVMGKAPPAGAGPGRNR